MSNTTDEEEKKDDLSRFEKIDEFVGKGWFVFIADATMCEQVFSQIKGHESTIFEKFSIH
eukprot:scaffold2767_cov177-Amphora_coffeaeformis.AAC.23